MVAKRQSVEQIGLLTTWYATVDIDRTSIRGPVEEIPSLAVLSSGRTIVLSPFNGAGDSLICHPFYP